MSFLATGLSLFTLTRHGFFCSNLVKGNMKGSLYLLIMHMRASNKSNIIFIPTDKTPHKRAPFQSCCLPIKRKRKEWNPVFVEGGSSHLVAVPFSKPNVRKSSRHNNKMSGSILDVLSAVGTTSCALHAKPFENIKAVSKVPEIIVQVFFT